MGQGGGEIETRRWIVVIGFDGPPEPNFLLFAQMQLAWLAIRRVCDDNADLTQAIISLSEPYKRMWGAWVLMLLLWRAIIGEFRPHRLDDEIDERLRRVEVKFAI
jgi:hypothetical protein